MNKKGQLSIINIIWFVITVIIGAVFTPVIDAFCVSAASGITNNTMALTIVSFVVPFFWLGIIITFFIYVIPQYIRPPQ